MPKYEVTVFVEVPHFRTITVEAVSKAAARGEALRITQEEINQIHSEYTYDAEWGGRGELNVNECNELAEEPKF